ncbi:hypothetical protein D3C85_1014310 [compost metagenome]
MHQAQEILRVVVFQVRVVVLQGQVFGDLPVCTAKTELVAVLGTAGNGKAGTVARSTAVGVLDLACGEGQVVDFLGGDDAAIKRLRQQATVVGHQDRQVGRQGATDMGFGLGDARLGVATDTAPLGNGRTIAVAWEECVVGVRPAATTAIQVDTPQRLRIKTKTDHTLRETRRVIQLEALGRLLLVGTCLTVVGVVIHSPRTECELAVFEKTGSAGLLGQDPYGHCKRQAGFVHVLLLWFLILVFIGRGLVAT